MFPPTAGTGPKRSFAFTRLKKTSKRNVSRLASCGKWHGSTGGKEIRGRNGNGKILGYMHLFTFKVVIGKCKGGGIPSSAPVGNWIMHQYSLVGFDTDYVLCDIIFKKTNTNKLNLVQRMEFSADTNPNAQKDFTIFPLQSSIDEAVDPSQSSTSTVTFSADSCPATSLGGFTDQISLENGGLGCENGCIAISGSNKDGEEINFPLGSSGNSSLSISSMAVASPCDIDVCDQLKDGNKGWILFLLLNLSLGYLSRLLDMQVAEHLVCFLVAKFLRLKWFGDFYYPALVEYMTSAIVRIKMELMKPSKSLASSSFHFLKHCTFLYWTPPLIVHHLISSLQKAMSMEEVQLTSTHKMTASFASLLYSYLSHWRTKVFRFADKYRGPYSNVSSPFYCSYSGYQDELLRGAAWLHRATKNQIYLNYIKLNG
ncbi:Endoglucanase 3 [Linum grandiflorum]